MNLKEKNLVELLRFQTEHLEDKTALKYKKYGRWHDKSWKQWWNDSQKIAAGLLKLGVGPNKNIGILSYTSMEWVEADIAILMLKNIVVTLFQTLLPSNIKYILEDSEAEALFVEDPVQLEKILKIWDLVPQLKHVIVFKSKVEFDKADESGRWKIELSEIIPENYKDRILTLDDLMHKGEEFLEENRDVVENLIKTIKFDDVARIIYTSGTTGEFKGAMLTHYNFISATHRLDEVLNLVPDDLNLLFLPLAHVYAHTAYMTALNFGITIAFAESIFKVVDNCGEVKPTFFASVPRLYEKIYANVLNSTKEAGGAKEKVFNWALNIGRKVSQLRQKGQEPNLLLKLQFTVADRLVFSKLKEKLGSKIRIMISGGAQLSKEIQEFFHAADLIVLEGFGMTEVVPPTNVNRPYKYRFGTVGPSLPEQEIKIADDGEILFRGGNVMKGYWKKEKETKDVIDDDGWLHSGDIGEIDEQGFLKITDRKKDIIVTSYGKNIAPQLIENYVKSIPMVSNVVILGDKRKCLAALITLDEESLKNWSKSNNIEYTENISTHPKVKEFIDKAVSELNERLESYQKVKKHIILPRDFKIGDEITPTLKLKRSVIFEKYKNVIEDIYRE